MRRQFGNRNAVKNTRYIELGWIHQTHLRTKQVRSRTGGGTRKICLRKDSTKHDILQEALRLFFPNGESPKGKVNEFQTDLWDFSERVVKESMTIQEMYDETKMPMLRFYLATCPKTDNTPTPSNASPHSNDVIARAMEVSGLIDDELPDINIDKHVVASLPESKTVDENIKSSWEEEDLGAENLPTFFFGAEIPDVLPVGGVDFLQDIVVKEIKVRVHRGQVLKDLIDAFKTIDLTNGVVSFEMVMPNGNVEVAEDGGGVTRDTLSEFWTSFFDQCTLGTEVKVPCLRHDYREKEWTAIGKVLLFGWQVQRYFPVSLARPFVEQCLYAKISSTLQDTFYSYIPSSEATLLKAAMSNFEEVDADELLDVMMCHDCRKIPTESTLSQIIEEIAHKELVQAPMFVCDCFHPVVKNLMNEHELDETYKKLIPTGRSVVGILSFPESMSADEINTCNHVKRFVKELTPEKLRRFLRFCTGSDLMVVDTITVNFVNVVGLARRPVAHTCSCLLELSKIFDGFPQFRSEFNSVLESNYWEMDII
ncbi:uncharacterized protein LOC144625415 [Crassostrea virginica]